MVDVAKVSEVPPDSVRVDLAEGIDLEQEADQRRKWVTSVKPVINSNHIMTSDTGPKGTEHHRCPTCGCKRFTPTVKSDVGPLYYFLGACEACGELVHCCTK
jgi:hypothetical protein